MLRCRAAVLKVVSALPEDKGSTFYPLFVSAITASLVPPFSEFFLSVLHHYNQQGHRRPHPDMSLAVVGENRQEKNRVGMEVQSLQVVMVENRKEELRKGGTRPAAMALMKSG